MPEQLCCNQVYMSPPSPGRLATALTVGASPDSYVEVYGVSQCKKCGWPGLTPAIRHAIVTFS
jgi:hypothetical protein